MPQTILVAEDTRELLESVRLFLSENGFAVIAAPDGSEALAAARKSRPDLVLADAEMPGLDGHSLCKLLRQEPATASVPVVIMSGSLVDEPDIVAGLDSGADDYIVKPFTNKVLLARIRAVLRRYAPAPDAGGLLKRSGIELDPAAREVRVKGKPVRLTRKEFDMLALLIERAGRVLKPGFLLETVWGYDLAVYNDTHTVETHISRLRKKIGARYIENVPGVGYKFGA